MPTINKRFVDSVSAPGYYRDSELKGFVLKVTETGNKTYLVNTKLKGTRKNVTVTLGKHGVLNPASARERAKEELRRLNDGVNPNEARRQEEENKQKEERRRDAQEKAEAVTLDRAFSDYLAFKNSKLKASTIKIYRYVFNARFSDWKDIRIIDITSDMVVKRHDEISKNFKGEADHAMRILRAIFIFAMEEYTDPNGEPLIRKHPTKRLKDKWNKLTPRTYAIKENELREWFHAVSGLDNKVAADYYVFLLFTGLRKNEAAKLKWKDFANLKTDDSFVDRRAGTFTIKNPKNGRDHTLPLTDYLAELIERRWDKRKNDFVFPGFGDKGHIVDLRVSSDKAIDAVRKATGDKDFYFSNHALRRTFITAAKRLGIDPDFVRGLANHKTGDVSSVHYTAMDDKDKLETMQKITDWFVKNGGLKKSTVRTKRKAAKVVAISKAR